MPKRPVVHTIYDKIASVDFAFAEGVTRRSLVRERQRDFDQYGPIADIVFGAIDDMGRGIQALTQDGLTMMKAYRAAAAEVDRRYALSGGQLMLVTDMLCDRWKQGAELRTICNALANSRRGNIFDQFGHPVVK